MSTFKEKHIYARKENKMPSRKSNLCPEGKQNAVQCNHENK
jgi:hypothetical protein